MDASLEDFQIYLAYGLKNCESFDCRGLEPAIVNNLVMRIDTSRKDKAAKENVDRQFIEQQNVNWWTKFLGFCTLLATLVGIGVQFYLGRKGK